MHSYNLQSGPHLIKTYIIEQTSFHSKFISSVNIFSLALIPFLHSSTEDRVSIKVFKAQCDLVHLRILWQQIFRFEIDGETEIPKRKETMSKSVKSGSFFNFFYLTTCISIILTSCCNYAFISIKICRLK